MEVILPPDLQQYLTDQVNQGRFSTIGDAVRGAVEVLRDQDADQEVRRRERYHQLDLSIEAEEQGDGVEVPPENLDDFFEGIKQRARQRPHRA